MNRERHLDDTILRQALLQAADIDIAFEAAAFDHLMQAVRTRPQQRAWPDWHLPQRRMVILLAGLVLLISVAGAVAVGTLLKPQPTPTPDPNAPMSIYRHNGIILTLNGGLFNVAQADGGEAPPLDLAAFGAVRSPSWSPDGKQLVGTFEDTVRIGDVSGGSVRTLWACEGQCQQLFVIPRWAPDGKSIAIGHGSQITIVSPGGEEITHFALRGHTVDALSWSADSDLLVVAVDQPIPHVPPDGGKPVARGTSRVFIVDLAGNVVRELLDTVSGKGAGVWDIAWSPDGQTIAYLADQWDGECCAFDFTLTTIRPDGTHKRAIADAGACYCAGIPSPSLAWSPDGTLIAFGKAGSGLYVIRPEGSGERRVSTAYVDAAWRPVP